MVVIVIVIEVSEPVLVSDHHHYLYQVLSRFAPLAVSVQS